MDNQDHRKNHTSGHDSHGVHVCHKCGWPFPNPHPSAKHRRAHKKICGTIEGYKLVDSQGSAHSTLSDDEHASDEDHKTPSPQMLTRSNDEKDNAGLGERSNRSEDEVFADAIAEFPDSGSGRGIQESPGDAKKPVEFVETILENDKKIALSFEDDTVTDGISPSSNLADSSQIQNTAVQGNYLSGKALECKTQVSGVTIGSVERPLTDFRTEESGCESIDEKWSSTCNSNPIQLEIQTDVSHDMEKTAIGDLADTDVKRNKAQDVKRNAGDDLIGVDKKENEKTHLAKHLLDAEMAGDNVIEASETFSKSVKIEDINSDAAAADGFIQLKEQCDDDLDSKKLLGVLSPAVESVGNMNTFTKIEVDAAEEMASASSRKLTETDNEKEDANDNFHVISVGDIPVVENAEIMIVNYKDNKAGIMHQSGDTDSLKVIDYVKDSDLKDKGSNFISSLLDEGTQVSALDVHVSKDKLEQEGGNSGHVVEKFLDETELDAPQVKVIVNEGQRTEEFYAPKDAASEVEKSCTIQCPQEQVPDDYRNNSSEPISLVHTGDPASDMAPVAVQANVKVRQISTPFKAGNHEKGGIGIDDIADNEEVKRITEDRSTGNIMATHENPCILSEVKVDGNTNSCAGVNAADNEKEKVESCCESGMETGKVDSTLGSVDGSHLVKTTMLTESAKDIHENCITSNDVVNASSFDISEPECEHLSRVSDHQVIGMGHEPIDQGKVQVEDVDRASAAGELDNVGENDELHHSLNISGDIEVLKKPSDKIDESEVLQKSTEPMAKEPPHSPLDASSSMQNIAINEDNHARSFVGAASENQSTSLPDDGEHKVAAEQLGASTTDFSVDSGSQTDSLEGHWGSNSVLSTQSDMQATVDSEHLVSNGPKVLAESEKADMKQPKALSEAPPQSYKSDMFEPPSFMTLVEPRGGDKDAASEIRIAENSQQPKAVQAGWFPSLTHVVNESQGRKKNEEIIAKVTNWSTGKQHTPLKNLLGEANMENKSKLPNANHLPVVQKDESSAKDDGSAPAANSVVSPQMPLLEPVTKEAAKEWNSPARYPADIKREKRKVKGRPYWAQFVCCSSVN